MTVADLIKSLQQQPPDLRVVMGSGAAGVPAGWNVVLMDNSSALWIVEKDGFEDLRLLEQERADAVRTCGVVDLRKLESQAHR